MACLKIARNLRKLYYRPSPALMPGDFRRDRTGISVTGTPRTGWALSIRVYVARKGLNELFNKIQRLQCLTADNNLIRLIRARSSKNYAVA